jgi:hypothetical protein
MSYRLIPGYPDKTSEEETLSMIRSILVEEPAEKPRVTPRKIVAKGKSAVKRTFVKRVSARLRGAAALPELEAAEAPEPPKRRPLAEVGKLISSFSVGGAFQHIYNRFRNFQPTTRHLAIVSTLLLVIVRPHWFVIGIVLALALVIGTFLALGAERIWRAVQAHLRRVEARDPARAVVLRDRLDRFACRWDAILDLFPDGMVDELYMPDLQAMEDADKAHNEAVAARLNRMTQES